MARIARVIAPGLPHHVTQRGNRCQQTFFHDDDYETYLALMSEWCRTYHVQVLAYCLMPNHVHLIAVPETEEGLARAIGEAHRRYTRRINLREKWRGHLWQERFTSFPMDESYLLAAVRYIEMNPVAAGMAVLPGEYRWSSAAVHLAGKDDQLVQVAPLLDMVRDWQSFLALTGEDDLSLLKKHERSGRPLGDVSFVEHLEHEMERLLRPAKRGPKPKNT